jgi:hypothetical protein
MKAMSFSAVEILPALLSHEKTQTIRPDFFVCKMCGVVEGQCPHRQKLSYYKVGDVIQLLWKQRTSPKDSWFCSKCGQQITGYTNRTLQDPPINSWVGETHFIDRIMKPCGCTSTQFPKIIGKVKITEVFQIEMWETLSLFGVEPNTINQYELFKRDGFKSTEEGQRYFSYNYGLRKGGGPFRFEVRRWEWLP